MDREFSQFTQFSFDQALEEIYWVDSGARIVYANNAMCSSVGYSHRELTALTLPDIDPDLTPEHWAHLFAEVKERGSINQERRHRNKRGLVFPVEVIAKYVAIGGEEFCCAFSRNISDRKRFEAALHQARQELEERVLPRSSELDRIKDLLADEVSERQRAELALSQEQNLLHTIIDQLPDYIYIKDTSGCLVMANQSQMELVGAKTADDIVGKTDFDLYPRALAKKYASDDQKVIATGKVLFNAEEPFLDRAGKIRWSLTTKIPLRDAEGQVVGVIGVGRDITERKQMEAVLARERNLTRTFLDNLPDCIYAKDIASRYTLVNAANLRVMGADTMDQVIGKLPGDYFPPDVANRLVEEDRQVMQTGIPLINSEHLIFDCSQQKDVWHSVTKLPLRNAEGNIIGLIGMSQDITERKQSAQALATEKEQLAVTLKSLGDGVITTDIQQRIVLFNPMAEQLTGWHVAEAVGKDLLEVFNIINARTRERLENPARRVIEHGVAVGLEPETALVARDGTEHLLSASVAPVRDNARQIVGVVVVFRDITLLRQAERALEEAREAEAANQAKSQFLAHMSHEIRTPIHGITGLTALVLNTKLTQEQREYVDMIQSSTELLLGLVNDILDLSKIEAGRLDLEAVPFDLHRVLEQAADGMAMRAHTRDLELILDIAPNVPNDFIGDPVRIRQVIMNLLSNAIKFTDSGYVTIRVTIPEDSGPVRAPDVIAVSFAVQDTGIGIAREKQTLIFEAFRQSDNSTTRQYGGTGLGLTISQQLVRRMGGHIELESEPGKGSVFTFTLPLQAQPGTRLRDILPLHSEWSGLSALVIDDNPASREYLHRILDQWGWEVSQAGTALAGLQMLEEAHVSSQPFALVLLDSEMPRMGGFVTANWFRDEPGVRNALVMMLPSNKAHQGMAQCQELGLAAYLIKPIKPRALYNAILAVQSGRRQEKEATENAVVQPAEEAVTGFKILLVEDNVVNQVIAKKLLEQSGCQVQVAGNGVEATKKYDKDKFDAILMDIEMPVMDGLAAARLIRKHETENALAHVPILAVTAYASVSNREAVLRAGMDGYLTKPFKIEKLRESLLPLLASRSTQSNAKTFDHAVALEAVGGSDEILDEVVGIFLAQDYPRHLETINSALARQDAETLRRAAHGLKGALLSLGGTAAADMAMRLQEIGSQRALERAPRVLSELEGEIERFSSDYLKFRQSMDK